MHAFDLIPLLTTVFYYASYPAYSKLLKGKLSSEGFWKVWFFAPLIVILSFSPGLFSLLIFVPLALAIVYFIIKGKMALAGALELALACLETFLYLKA